MLTFPRVFISILTLHDLLLLDWWEASMLRLCVVISAHWLYSGNSFLRLHKCNKVPESGVFLESINIFVSDMYGIIWAVKPSCAIIVHNGTCHSHLPSPTKLINCIFQIEQAVLLVTMCKPPLKQKVTCNLAAEFQLLLFSLACTYNSACNWEYLMHIKFFMTNTSSEVKAGT